METEATAWDEGRTAERAADVSVGTFPTYEDAERAVDRLSDDRFPVERVTIVGRGLRFVERVTGRRGYGETAGQTAISGALLGALFGWFLGLFGWVDPLVSAIVLALYGAALGLLVGALIGLALHALTRGRRDFSSVRQMEAERYEILVPRETAQAARQSLASAYAQESASR